MRWEEHQVVRQRQQSLGERPVQRARHLVDRVIAVSMQVGPPCIADQQRISGQDEPRVVATRVIGDHIDVVRQRMAGRGHRPDLGVPERHRLAVAEWVMCEVDTGPFGQVRGCTRTGHELRQAGDVIGLHVRLEDGDDRSALRLGEPDVLVDEVGVGIHNSECAVGLAPEEVRGAGGLVVQQLSEVHAGLQEVEFIAH